MGQEKRAPCFRLETGWDSYNTIVYQRAQALSATPARDDEGRLSREALPPGKSWSDGAQTIAYFDQVVPPEHITSVEVAYFYDYGSLLHVELKRYGAIKRGLRDEIVQQLTHGIKEHLNYGRTHR